MIVADVGAGPGYFALRFGKLVGPTGWVYAVDARADILDRLQSRIERAKAANVAPVLGLAHDPLLPPGSCDLVFLANAFHHFSRPAEYLRTLARCLRPGGRIAIVDFHERELPVGPPPEEKISRERLLKIARSAGLRVAAEYDFLPYQYFFVLRPRSSDQ